MINIKTTDEKGIIEIEVDGKISDHDINDFRDYVQGKQKGEDKLNLLIVVKDLDYTLEGLKEEIKFNMNHFDVFHKIAMVSDKKWLELSSKLAKQLPGVSVKHFDTEEKEKALFWLR